MADKIVRSINGVRNIDKLSRNITTENDLISTTDNEVYVVTNEGYKKITWSELESDIEHIETDVSQLLSDTSNHKKEINTLKEKTDNNKSLIEGIDLTGYAKKEDIPDEVDLTGYAKKEDIPDEVDLSGYAKKEDIPTNYNKKITSTGWLNIKAKNGYEVSQIIDFEPSYSIVDYGEFKEIFIRFGFKNLMQSKNVVAEIPSNLVPYKIYSNGTTTIAKVPPKIVITTDGNIEIYQYTKDEYIEKDYVIYQGSWIINKEDE